MYRTLAIIALGLAAAATTTVAQDGQPQPKTQLRMKRMGDANWSSGDANKSITLSHLSILVM